MVTATNDHAGELLSLTVYEDGTSLGFVRRFNFGPTFALSESTITVGGEPVRLLTIDLVGGTGIASSMVGANNVDLIRCPTFGAVTTALAKFDADDVLQVGDVGDAGDCLGVDIRADSIITFWIAGNEAFATDGTQSALWTPTVQWAASVASPIIAQEQSMAGAGQSMQIAPQQGAAGERGGNLLISGGEPGTTNDSKWGHITIDLGDPDTSDDDKTASLQIKAGAAGLMAEIYSDDVGGYTLAFVPTVRLFLGGIVSLNVAEIAKPITRTVYADSIAAGSHALVDNAVQQRTITGNVTLTAPVAGYRDGAEMEIHIIQGGAGSFTVSWPVAFDWGDAGAPTLSTVAGKRDVVVGTVANSKFHVRTFSKGHAT